MPPRPASATGRVAVNGDTRAVCNATQDQEESIHETNNR